MRHDSRFTPNLMLPSAPTPSGTRYPLRFTEGSGWLEGTQAFLQIEPRLSKQPGRLEHPPSEKKARKNEDRLARVLITVRRRRGWDFSG